MKGPSCREQACYSHHAALWHVAHDIIKQESDAGSHRLPCAVLRDILAHVICNPFRGEDRLAIRVRSENNGKGHQVAVHVCAITWKVETPEPLSALIFENHRAPGPPFESVASRNACHSNTSEKLQKTNGRKRSKRPID